MKKKGTVSLDTVVVAILVVLFIIFGAQWIGRIFTPRLDEKIINQACYQSISFNQQKRVPGLETELAPPKCATKYITFHEDKAEQEFESNPLEKSTENKPVKMSDVYYRDEKGNQCKDSEDKDACMFRGINKVIADEMARCWSNFHRGDGRVFSVYTEKRQCLVCSVFLFDEKIASNTKYNDIGPIGLAHSGEENFNLDLFMRNNNNLEYTGNDNYYQYTLDFMDSNVELPYYDYDINHEYSIVFVALNKDAVKLMSEAAWNKFLGGRDETWEAEEGNYMNTLEFIQNDEVGQICDTWV
jgi:hypothetical protein